VRVYGANDAFLLDQNPTVAKVLDVATVVVVTAAAGCRKKRLITKTMTDAERAIRMASHGLPQLGCVSIRTIDTTYLTPEEGQAAFRSLAAEVLALDSRHHGALVSRAPAGR
jgi:hypothetical protein